jgi:hypothetical protein
MIFLPLRKVDAAQRLIYARLDETPDRVGMVMDYASSKPEFQKWSDELRKASGEKSLGNLRAMHQLKAAGKLEAIDYDDTDRAIEICAKVVDDDEWRKVEEGVYTGISPGGRYVKRWQDGAHCRYTAGPSEISLVDLPCIPSATFTMVKADGAEEQRPFLAKPALASGLKKDLGDVGQLASLVQGLAWFASSITTEASAEADGSPLPARLAAAVEELSEILVAYASEESQEAVASLNQALATIPGPVMAQAAKLRASRDRMAKMGPPAEALAKVGARNSQADLSHIQAIHDHARDLGAGCGGAMEKAASTGEMAKIAADLATAQADNAMLKRRIAALEAAPAPGGAHRNGVAIDRSDDTGARSQSLAAPQVPPELAALPNGPDKALKLMRWTMDNPQPPAMPRRLA